MSKLTALKTRLKKFTPAAAGLGLVTLAGSASAADLSTAINSSVTDATGNVTLVATGLIAIAAVMMGVGIVVSALKR
jgi:predicted outer membrane protein